MTIVEITGGMLRAGRAPVGLSLEDLAGSRESRRQQSCQWRGVPSAKVLRWCAARLLLRTLTDEFAFRRISRIDVRVLPIQIEHRWQDIAASTPPLPCADYLAVTTGSLFLVAATTVTSCRRVRGGWSSAQDERPWN